MGQTHSLNRSLRFGIGLTPTQLLATAKPERTDVDSLNVTQGKMPRTFVASSTRPTASTYAPPRRLQECSQAFAATAE